MKQTTPLLTPSKATAAFELAWKRAEHAYSRYEVNSEASLQAHLFAGLRCELPTATIYCAARLVLPGKTRRYVDMLICQDDRVLALVELKYKPNVGFHRSGAKVDLAKLLQFRGRRSTVDKIELEVSRFRGSTTGECKELKLQNAANLIFASMTRPDPTYAGHEAEQLRKHIVKTCVPPVGERASRRSFPKRLTILHGITERQMKIATTTLRGRDDA